MPATEDAPPVCWCGGAAGPFSPDYAQCPACGTLIFRGPVPDRIHAVGEDEQGFYGLSYWFERQTGTHGLSDLPTRATEDLRIKCPSWLRALMSYCLPPARVLEVGSAHGAFVATLKWAGYEASGLELSPAVAEWARKQFDVPMFVGELRRQHFPDASFDAVCLFDVLEHLTDPLADLRECRRILKPGGLLLLQTPETPADKDYQQLLEANHPFLGMLIPVEHLHLFSQAALREALARTGFPWCQPLPSLSPDFNMTLASSASELRQSGPAAVASALRQRSGGRLVEALLQLEHDYTVADRDRRGRQEAIAVLEKALEEATAAHARERAELGARLDNSCREVSRQARIARQAEARLDLMEKHWLVRLASRATRWAPAAPARLAPEPPALLRRLAVDLTPMMPGGENGGAKVLALEQIRQLSGLLPHAELVLLTLARTEQELLDLHLDNVRIDVVEPPSRFGVRSAVLSGIDLLYCPFTAPFFRQPGQPVVSFVHDLQFADYPQFFSGQVVAERRAHLQEAVRSATVLVCGTEFVKASLARHLEVPPEKVMVIPHAAPRRRPAGNTAVLTALGLEAGGYYLYPANYWKHKNHQMLLTAYGMYRNGGGRTRLAFTGAPGPAADQLREAAAQMGLGEAVIQAGFLPEDDFSTLFACAGAIVFPSLYEGFGMPVLEAMLARVPILCANSSCLPEVAGDAALYFDPRKPAEIATRMLQLEQETGLRQSLVARGDIRAASFGSATLSAVRLLDAFGRAVRILPDYRDQMQGVFPDSWTGPSVMFGWSRRSGPGLLEIELEAPPWLPAEEVTVNTTLGGSVAIPRGSRRTLELPAGEQGGWMELHVHPVFQPCQLEQSGDTRTLGLRLLAARLHAGGEVTDLTAVSELAS